MLELENTFRSKRIAACVAVALICVADHVEAVPMTFINDFVGWSAATGSFDTIDFETLPDGRPSVAGTLIAPDFNYTDAGAILSAFSVSPVGPPPLIIGGNPIGGFDVRVGDFFPGPPVVGIRAELVAPAPSVSIFYPGGTTLTAFDASEQIIASVSHFSSGSGLFLGIVSDSAPIASITVSRGSSIEVIQSLQFSSSSSVPAPSAILLVVPGLLALTFRRPKRT